MLNDYSLILFADTIILKCCPILFWKQKKGRKLMRPLTRNMSRYTRRGQLGVGLLFKKQIF